MMLHIRTCCKEGKKIETIGIPEDWTPHDLCTYYIEQYNILEEAKKHSMQTLIVWLEAAKSREDHSVVAAAEIKILKELVHD